MDGRDYHQVWRLLKPQFYKMKTILVLTDFSINADYVGRYALKLAQNIGANILLCNIYQSPAGKETTGNASWPLSAGEGNSIN
jgi:hypothetical protein